jgi:hypothetical protein
VGIEAAGLLAGSLFHDLRHTGHTDDGHQADDE